MSPCRELIKLGSGGIGGSRQLLRQDTLPQVKEQWNCEVELLLMVFLDHNAALDGVFVRTLPRLAAVQLAMWPTAQRGCSISDHSCLPEVQSGLQVSPQDRGFAKQLAYGLLYGMGAQAIASVLKVPRPRAQELQTTFKASLPGIMAWQQRVLADCRCCTVLGRAKEVCWQSRVH